jgi:D-alanyl-D-alanine carboxypeptidase
VPDQTEELRLVVTLVDNASGPLDALRAKLTNTLAGPEAKQAFESHRKQSTELQKIIKELGGGFEDTLKIMNTFRGAMLGTAGTASALAGSIALMHKVMSDWASELRQVSQAANVMGIDPAELKDMTDQLGRFGISADATVAALQRMNQGIADLRREGSQLQQQLLMAAGSDPARQRNMQQLIQSIKSAQTEEEKWRVIAQAREAIIDNAIKNQGRTRAEAADAAAKALGSLYQQEMAYAKEIEDLSDEDRKRYDERIKKGDDLATTIGRIKSELGEIKEIVLTPLLDVWLNDARDLEKIIGGIVTALHWVDDTWKNIREGKAVPKDMQEFFNQQGTPPEAYGGTRAPPVGPSPEEQKRTTDENTEATKKQTESTKELSDALKANGYQPMSYTGGGFNRGMVQNASFTTGGGGGGGYGAFGGGPAFGGGGGGGGGGDGYGGPRPHGSDVGAGSGAGAGETPAAVSGASGAGGAGGAAGLAAQRAPLMDEVNKDPATKHLLHQMMSTEGGGAATVEALVNRTAMIRKKIPGYSIKDELNSGFYGPIKSGKAQRTDISPAEAAGFDKTIAGVAAGSNVIQGRTNQGMASDPGANLPGRVPVPGSKEVYNYWEGQRKGVGFSTKDSAAFAAGANAGGVESGGVAGGGDRGGVLHGYSRRKGEAGEFNYAATGAFGAAGEANQTTITLKNGKSVQVNKALAGQYKGFLDTLIDRGYNIESVGGYNYRGKRGGGGLSMHAYGAAVDINPGRNPMGGKSTDLPSDVEQMAWAHGLSWGGRFGDPMHFEPMSPQLAEARKKLLQQTEEARQQLNKTQSAETTVNANGKLDVNVNAPKNTDVKASGNGLFKDTTVNRQTQMEPAAKSTGTSQSGDEITSL